MYWKYDTTLLLRRLAIFDILNVRSLFQGNFWCHEIVFSLLSRLRLILSAICTFFNYWSLLIQIHIFLPLFLSMVFDCLVYRGVGGEVFLVEHTVFHALKGIEGLHDCLVLASINLARTLLDLLDALIIVVEFFRLEVGDTCRCPIFEHARIIDHVSHPQLVLLDIKFEIVVMGHHMSIVVFAELSTILMDRDVIVADYSTIAGHTKLTVDRVHDQLQFDEEVLVNEVRLKLFDHFISQLKFFRGTL